ADAGRTPDQPGMGEPRASIGGKQRALRLGVAVEDGGLARVQRFDAVGLVVGVAHDAAPAGKLDTRVESSRSVTAFQMRSATAAFGSVASIATQRPGSAGTISRYGSRNASWNARDSASNRSANPSPRRF